MRRVKIGFHKRRTRIWRTQTNPPCELHKRTLKNIFPLLAVVDEGYTSVKTLFSSALFSAPYHAEGVNTLLAKITKKSRQRVGRRERRSESVHEKRI